MTNLEKLIPQAEIDITPEDAILELPGVIVSLEATEARCEESQGKRGQCREVEAEDKFALEWLHRRLVELTAASRELRAKYHDELRSTRDACDAAALAAALRAADDLLGLHAAAYDELTSTLLDKHRLATQSAEVELLNLSASAATKRSDVAHLRSIAALVEAFKDSGRLAFVSEKVEKLRGAAAEAHRRAEVASADLREAEITFAKKQETLTNTRFNARFGIGS